MRVACMGQFKYILSSLWFWVIIVLSCFYVENIALLSNGLPMEGFSNPVFYIITAVILAMMVVYFFLEYKKNKIKAGWVVLSILIILFICICIAIWTNPSSTHFIDYNTGKDATLTYSINEKIRYTIQLFISFVVLYMMMFTFVKGRLRFAKLKWLAYAVIILVVLASIFSLVFEIGVYKTIFEGNPNGKGVGSFFINPNIFGLCLMLGMMACVLINFPHSKWWSYILMLFFFGIMIFTLSNTALLISSGLLVIYLSAKIIKGYIQRHYIRSSVFIILIFAVAIGLLIVYLIGESKQWPFMVAFKEFLRRFVFRSDFKTFSNRTEIWSWALDLLKKEPMRLIFGYGYGASSKLIMTYSSIFEHTVRTCHSGYVEVFLMSGIVGLSFYSFGIGFGFYCIIRLFIRKQFRFALMYLMFYFCILTHNLVESTRFFDVSTSGAIIMLLFFLPPIAVWQHMRKPQLVKQAIHNDVWQNNVSSTSIIRVITLVIVSLILTLSISFLTNFPYENVLFRNIILWTLFFFVANLLFLPYLVALIYGHSTNTRFVVRLVIYGTLLLGIGGGVGYAFYANLNLGVFNTIILSILCYLVAGLILTTIFRFIFRGRFKAWLFETIHAIVVTPGLAVPFTAVLGGTITIIINAFIPFDALTLLTVIGMNLLIFYLAFTFIPFKDRTKMAKEFNDEGLFNWRRAVVKDKI